MITFDNVCKSFDGVKVLSEISFTVEQGETFCLLGKSGSGKTTILKLFNKLILPSSGKISFGNKSLSDLNTYEWRQNTGYVIQSAGLFPHLKIAENIALPLQLQKRPKAEINDRVRELIGLIGLDETFLQRYPDTLSGGQLQRVGIARAIANQPDLLLLDEPFSALDPILREQMQNEFLQMSFLKDVTKILVTHDLTEALKLSDRICLISQGKIAFIGSPLAFLKTTNEAVKHYIGQDHNLFKIRQLKLGDLPLENEPGAETDSNEVVTLTPETYVYLALSEDKNIIRIGESGPLTSKTQLKNAFLSFIERVI
ncbi:MAG: ABC transporter ATP-binding protein [Bacteroidota bacterium]